MIALHHAISIYPCLTSWPPSLDKSTSSIEMRTKNAFLFSKDQLDLVYLCWNLFAYIMKHINQTYYVMSIPSKYLNINVLQNLRCLKYYTSKRNISHYKWYMYNYIFIYNSVRISKCLVRISANIITIVRISRLLNNIYCNIWNNYLLVIANVVT